MMKKRTVVAFCAMMALTIGLAFRVLSLSQGEQLAQAAELQSTYTLRIPGSRGTVFDTRMRPMTNTDALYKAAIVSTPESLQFVSAHFSGEEAAAIRERMAKGKPILVNLPGPAEPCDGVQVFRTTSGANPAVAAQTLGYLNGDGDAVSGIQKAYDDWLSAAGEDTMVRYKVDALGRTLTGEQPEIEHYTAENQQGVVLTLDQRLQTIAEEVAKETMKTGAVVILEVPTAEIRAMISVPTFTVENLQESLENPDGPLVNRALSPYNLGSIFKLVSAAAAMETGNDQMVYLCEGTTEYAGHTFQCIGATKHGEVNLQRALSVSCNCYFINLSPRIGGKTLLEMAGRLGFGKNYSLASGIENQKGTLPTADSLQAPAALANFSFGQGDLMATPLQIAALVNAIVNQGDYMQPRLMERTTGPDGETVRRYESAPATRAMQKETAQALKDYMVQTVMAGTAGTGRPEDGGAGAKTATAETGWIKNGHSVIQAWFAGFFPAEQPRYVVVVLAEDGKTGSGTCGPIFKKIVDRINNELGAELGLR